MRTRIILAVLAVAVIAAGSFWWLRAGRQAAIVDRVLPAMPDMADAPAELRERVRAADAEARHRLTALRGLAALARLYHSNGYLEQAMRCYAGLEKLEPNQPRWFHYDATILGGYGEIGRAEKLWRRVLQLAPDYIPARLRLGECLLKTDRLAEATAMYDSVLKRDPGNPYAMLNLARIDMEHHDWAKARPLLESVVRKTNFTLGYDLIVTLYDKIGLRTQANEIRGAAKASGAYHDLPDPWMNELMDVCYDPYRLGLVAGLAAHNGSPARAVQLLKRAIALAPNDVSSHFQLAGVSEMQRNFKEALAEYQECTVLDPHFSDGWAHLSDLQSRMGDKGAAARTLAQGLVQCPDSPGLHLMRARRLRDAGRAGEAIREYEISIRLRPNEPEAYTQLGRLLIGLGRVDAGMREMRLALEADPGDPMALGVMAFHAISTNDEAAARRWLVRVVDQPRVPQAQTDKLLAAYRQTFGHAWTPEKGQ